jgi:hypothetical protein
VRNLESRETKGITTQDVWVSDSGARPSEHRVLRKRLLSLVYHFVRGSTDRDVEEHDCLLMHTCVQAGAGDEL